MVLMFSLLCFLANAFLLVDKWFLEGSCFAMLPVFTVCAVAVAGVLIAALEYRVRKTKKKKKHPQLLLIVNAFCGCIGAFYWIMQLLA
ncbi:MAG: hypothetical protein LBS18_02110 [Clostridiales bacterium]|nr:hypothetical protein [Clostridiales bacterium]